MDKDSTFMGENVHIALQSLWVMKRQQATMERMNFDQPGETSLGV